MENEIIRPQLHTSIRQMVEFLLREGDIDNRGRGSSADAMLEGGRIHRMIQSRMGGDYRAEVPLKTVIADQEFDIVIEGRADGIFAEKIDGMGLSLRDLITRDTFCLEDFEQGELAADVLDEEQIKKEYEEDDYSDISEVVLIDEIKGVHRDLRRMTGPVGIHLAQAKSYAAIYLLQNDDRVIGVQMTYCNMDTQIIKRFRAYYRRETILQWFEGMTEEYRKWARFKYEWRKIRQDSIHNLDFPFEYRDGQKELAASVYRTIYLKKRLFLEAPTGVGKTISTLFPAIKALGENKGEMIFYLTAKTLTSTVAIETYDTLRQLGLRMKTVSITAKEKMCPMEEMECNPMVCPYAKGHYDRINDAMYDLLNQRDDFTREAILTAAEKHQVCPFEFCLDMSLFADGVICDYNYVFDPNVYLRRFFQEGIKGDYLFLIDEAHNLVDRAREMYSAVLKKDSFIEARKLVKPFDPKLARAFDTCNKQLLEYMRESDDTVVRDNIDPFLISLTRAAGYLDEFLEEDEGSSIRREILDFYFEIRHFLNMAELMQQDYRIYTRQMENGDFFIKLLCVDPSRSIKNCLDRGSSSVFFSATLLPVGYYMDLLSGDRGDYTVYAKSSFDPSNRGIFVARDVSSRYKRRTQSEFEKIADYISIAASSKAGNYMVFFPSYRFMEDVYDIFEKKYSGEFEVVCQNPSMSEDEREEFLGRFDMADSFDDRADLIGNAGISFDIEDESETSLIGFCVMGGIFSEGIDLKKDSLIGAIIVGTGLPQVGPEMEIIRDFFDHRDDGRGFDYAYRFPGMNKVLQSAGRVIRTAQDRGIILLLDDRFMYSEYRELFPREWEKVKDVSLATVTENISNFWKNN